jgi:hypothetical protein
MWLKNEINMFLTIPFLAWCYKGVEIREAQTGVYLIAR